MGSAINKFKGLNKADRQAAVDEQIRQAQETQQKMASNDPDDLDIDDLLGPAPTKVSRSVRSSTPRKSSTPRTSTPATLKGEMIAFITQKGERVIAPGVRYMVVRFEGRLHYKQEASVVYLPDDWQEGDPIPWPDSMQDRADVAPIVNTLNAESELDDELL